MGFAHSVPTIAGSFDFQHLSLAEEDASDENTRTVNSKLGLMLLEFRQAVRLLSAYTPLEKEIVAHMQFRAAFAQTHPEADEAAKTAAYQAATEALFVQIETNIQLLAYFKQFIARALGLAQTALLLHKQTVAKPAVALSRFSVLVQFFELVFLFDDTKLVKNKLNLDISYFRRLLRTVTMESSVKINLDNLTLFFSHFNPYFNFVRTILQNVGLENEEVPASLRVFGKDLFNAISSDFFDPAGENKDLLEKTSLYIAVQKLALCLARVICVMDHVEVDGVFHEKSQFPTGEILKSMKGGFKKYDHLLNIEELLGVVRKNSLHFEDKNTQKKIRKILNV